MSRHPPVTVLMPNYNGARHIREAIESVLAQTYQDFEFLIVEDASTDASPEIIAGFDDARIRVVCMPTNQHICHALNEGLRAARGAYIARMDSDDVWHPDKLARQMAYMERHPDCGASFTWVNVIDEDGRARTAQNSPFVELFRMHNMPREAWVRHFFFNGSCLCHPSAVIPKHVFDEVGPYDNALVQVQDYDLWVRIAKRYPLHIIEHPLMDYRHSSAGGHISAHNYASDVRSGYEFSRVLRRYFSDMTDDAFRACFGEDFTLKDAQDKKTLLCERALMLLKPVFCGHAAKLGGMDALADLLNDDAARTILRDRYGITQMNFYELSASPVLHQEDPALALMPYGRKMLAKAIAQKTLAPHPRLARCASGVYRALKRGPKGG